VARDDVQSVAAALLEPRQHYVARVARARDAVEAHSLEAARALTVFLDRIADLEPDELSELHDETFRAGWAADLRRTASALASGPASTAGTDEAIDVVTTALFRLEADRNPFAYVARALYCLLQSRVRAMKT
jgi:nitrate reductase assembly molybdenum cofactor insertion protein NarJ